MNFTTTRRPIEITDPELVRVSAIWPKRHLPVLILPEVDGVDLAVWIAAHRPQVDTIVARHGGVLFRGFDVRSAADFAQVVSSFSTELIDYTERSTPRSKVSAFLYTSTEYPADQVIPLHNENSYSHTWPLNIWFFCEQPAVAGGETSIADSRDVFALLDAGLRDRFLQRGVAYVRNYSASLGLSWQETFQTGSPAEVDRYCAAAGILCDWKGDRLTTRQVRPAVANHPGTGQSVWFNQAHLFHASSLPATIYHSLASTMPEDEFPRHAYYGDGAPIEQDALAHIRDVYDRARELVSWQRGDVLLLDNMLTAHGRQPYGGARRVLVAMARPCAAT